MWMKTNGGMEGKCDVFHNGPWMNISDRVVYVKSVYRKTQLIPLDFLILGISERVFHTAPRCRHRWHLAFPAPVIYVICIPALECYAPCIFKYLTVRLLVVGQMPSLQYHITISHIVACAVFRSRRRCLLLVVVVVVIAHYSEPRPSPRSAIMAEHSIAHHTIATQRPTPYPTTPPHPSKFTTTGSPPGARTITHTTSSSPSLTS